MGHHRRIHPQLPQRSLAELVSDALVHLRALGYSEKTLYHYERAWRLFLEFARQASCTTLSRNLIGRFLASRRVFRRADPPSLVTQEYTARAMRILSEFREAGNYRRFKRKIEPLHIPDRMRPELEAYEEFCSQHLGLRAITMFGRRRVLENFLFFAGSRGVAQVGDIGDACLSAFVSGRSRRLNRGSLSSEVGILRGFLRYLCMRGRLPGQVAEALPSIRGAKEHRLPSVWPREAVSAVLRAFDRSSPVGRRDYAIVLLACRLGLRASDIRALRLENIDWEQDRISIIQSKTRRPLTLPLDRDVGAAILDYLKHGRPVTEYRQVFLKTRAPFEPVGRSNGFHGNVAAALCRAKVDLPPGTRRGLHSLRHTLATQLLQSGVPFPTIAGVLGHKSMDSTRTYTRVDLKALRTVALDPDEACHG